MEKEKIAFQDKRFYPLLFMILLTAIFVAILGILFHSSEQKIKAQQVLAKQTQQVNIFADSIAAITKIDRNTLTAQSNIPKTFQTYYKEETKPFTYYRVETPGHFIGFCFNITGSGLWGTMDAFVGTSPDMNRIINFSIYQQQETPGLGARVTETWYKKQFSSKLLRSKNQVIMYTLVPEGATPGPTEIRQITGATITSSSVSKMLQKEMSRIIPLIEKQQQTEVKK
jgi:Na+-transporting NADH:ubiquinone oxidoreductase subunit C